MSKLIELKNIKKSYGQRVILENVNCVIEKNEIVSIMGDSGSGKTTLLNILGFLDVATSGYYYLEEKKVNRMSQKAKIRNEYMGFVFQSYNLISKLTVYENIMLPIYYSVKDNDTKKELIKKIPELLERYNISHIKDVYVDYISGGEKQRVCLARALACGAEIIIADEPTGNLDENNRENVLEEFIRLNREGKTIIIVTHDPYVAQIANKKLMIKDRQLVNYEV